MVDEALARVAAALAAGTAVVALGGFNRVGDCCRVTSVARRRAIPAGVAGLRHAGHRARGPRAGRRPPARGVRAPLASGTVTDLAGRGRRPLRQLRGAVRRRVSCASSPTRVCRVQGDRPRRGGDPAVADANRAPVQAVLAPCGMTAAQLADPPARLPRRRHPVDRRGDHHRCRRGGARHGRPPSAVVAPRAEGLRLPVRRGGRRPARRRRRAARHRDRRLLTVRRDPEEPVHPGRVHDGLPDHGTGQ